MKYSLKEKNRQEVLKKYKDMKPFARHYSHEKAIQRKLLNINERERVIKEIKEKISVQSPIIHKNNVENTISNMNNLHTVTNAESKETKSIQKFNIFKKFNNINPLSTNASYDITKPSFLKLIFDTVSKEDKIDTTRKDILNTEEYYTNADKLGLNTLNKELSKKIKKVKPPRQPCLFITDEIIYQYKKYIKEKDKQKKEYDEFGEKDDKTNLQVFNIQSFFQTQEDIDRKINSIRLPTVLYNKNQRSRLKSAKSHKSHKTLKYKEDTISYNDNDKSLKLSNNHLSTKSNKKIQFASDNTNSDELVQTKDKNYNSLGIGVLSQPTKKKNFKENFRNKSLFFKELNTKVKKLLKENKQISLEDYQQLLMRLVGNNISDEYLKCMATSFKEIAEKNKPKIIFTNDSEYRQIIRKLKGPKSRWDTMLDKIAPYIPEYLTEKLRSLK